MIDSGKAHDTTQRQQTRPVMLVVMDGWGYREDKDDNAIAQAKTPNFSALWATSAHGFLRTSGADVGLPDDQMGNSEVGHLNIGAGRVVLQDLPRINEAVTTGALAEIPEMRALIDTLRGTGGTCHLVGLVSPGGVHSQTDHAIALAGILANAEVPTVMHVITDGRDTPPRSAAGYIDALRAALPASVRIGTVCGRYYAMDRDQRWERVAKAYAAIVDSDGLRFANAAAVIADAYARDIGDEFVVPAIVGDYEGMQDGDGLLCFNFRPDRVREILTAILDPEFEAFPRPRTLRLAAAAGLTQYSDKLNALLQTLFPPRVVRNSLGEIVSAAGRKQLRIAETEKYAHVTYFLNGGAEDPYLGEDRILVPSPKVATYDLQPEMSAPEVADKVVESIQSGKYDLIVVNFANPDMVGHTGNLAAAVKAVETVDTALGRLVEAIRRAGGAMLVTADHGNCELMRDAKSGAPHTAHTTTPVPVVLVDRTAPALLDGRLSDIAPTLLELMGLPQPAEMTGVSLLHPRAER